MKRAACALIERNGKVLSVSRRGRPEMYGLPGGKIEDGEEPWQTAVRETFEETGVVITVSPTPVYTATDAEGWYTETFKALTMNGTPSTQPGEGDVNWVTHDDLCFGVVFAEYNKGLFRR